MRNDNNNKKEPWRFIVFIPSVLLIVFLWIRNDIASIYATMPKEQVVPLIATTIGVSLIKVGAIVGAVFLIKWLIRKITKKND